MSSANLYQVGGSHYKTTIEHWDWAWVNELDFFQYQITKYVARWRKKGGIEDLLKAKHFLEKYIELLQIQVEDEQDSDDAEADLIASRRAGGEA